MTHQMHFDFNVDENNIHLDLTALPSQVFEAGEMVANTRRLLDEYKRQLDMLQAQADTNVRLNPAVFNIAKVTEAAVVSAIDRIPEIQDLRQKIIEAKHANDVAYAAVNALETKRKSLESLVQLRSIGYYAARSA